MTAPKREHRVVSLGGNKYRLVTTVTAERIVTGEELDRLNIKRPGADVPWSEPAPAAPVIRRDGVVRSPYAAAMTFWRDQGFPIDKRMTELLPGWLDEFKLEGVLDAMRIAIQGHGPPFVRLVHQFRLKRGGR